MSSIGSILTPRTEGFFDMKKLDKAGVARVEAVVKDARDTLALADKLQGARDLRRALWTLEDSLKPRAQAASSSISGGASKRVIDILL